jgi:hypothetical protein
MRLLRVIPVASLFSDCYFLEFLVNPEDGGSEFCELERMKKDALMAYVEVLSWNLHGGTEENQWSSLNL